MKAQQTNILEQRKQEFLKLYREDADLTMFKAAVKCGLGVETLTVELKTDRNFYNQTKEICGLRVMREVNEMQEGRHE